MRQAAGTHTPGNDGELRSLGLELGEHAGEVLERISVRANSGGQQLAAPARSSFARMCMLATTTLALWMAADAPERGGNAAREAWQLFGDLAANREAPIDEVVRRCLMWRDCVAEVLRERAAALDSPPEVLARAIAMTQTTLDATLVRIGATSDVRDVSSAEKVSRKQDSLAFAATHEEITGLPNRALMLDRAAQMLARARRHGTCTAALVVNVDGAGVRAEAIGTAAREDLLRAIASRLAAIVRDADALGYLGGERFVLLADDVSAASGTEAIAERVRNALREPFLLPGHSGAPISLTASVGVASESHTDPEDLIRGAEMAMRDGRLAGTTAIGC